MLPPVPATQLPPDFRTQVLLLRPGQTTRPMPISGGLAIIKLVGIKQEAPRRQGAEDKPAARERCASSSSPQRITSFGAGLPAGAARRRADRRSDERLPVALTLGDPAGIGGEIALKAWAELRGRLPFFLIGDLAHMGRARRRLGVPVQRDRRARRGARRRWRAALPVLPHPLPAPAEPGRPDPANAARGRRDHRPRRRAGAHRRGARRSAPTRSTRRR